MISHILSNLLEEYQTIVENLEENLYDDSDFITIEIFCDKILVKYEQMNKQSRPKFHEKMKITFT